MIVVAEGPSAAGKTTWCRRHATEFVAEYAPSGSSSDPIDRPDRWTAVNIHRWAEARTLERRIGVAVCDGDPLKLHYSWCLSKVGAVRPDRFARELEHTRRAFSTGDLGLADLVLVSIPPPETLRGRRDGDPARSRRNFDLHARLAEHLRAWYRMVEALDPGRVVWDLPPGGLPVEMPTPRPMRSDVTLLDHLVASLP